MSKHRLKLYWWEMAVFSAIGGMFGSVAVMTIFGRLTP